MRRLVLVLAAGSLPARPAAACSGPCPSPVWWYLEPASGPSIPRDGAVVFEGGRTVDQCLEELAPFLVVEVTRAGTPVPGAVTMPDGTDLLVFRPDAPWQPGAGYHARVTIDNAGIAPFDVGLCAEATKIAELDFAVSDELGPPLPVAPDPAVTASTATINNAIDGVVCCPAADPQNDGTAGCTWEIFWTEPGSCTFLYDYTYLTIEPAGYALPPALQGQVLYELVIDGVAVARDHVFDYLSAVRGRPGCVSFAATYLGTGETRRSSEVCTPAEVAAQLGTHLRDVAGELACADPLVCTDEYTWDPADCSPFDPEAPPPAPDPMWFHPDTVLVTCDGSPNTTGGPDTGGADTGAPGTGETGSEDVPGDSSGDGDAAGASGGLAERGCGCAQSPGGGAHMSPGLLLLMGLLRRRGMVVSGT